VDPTARELPSPPRPGPSDRAWSRVAAVTASFTGFALVGWQGAMYLLEVETRGDPAPTLLGTVSVVLVFGAFVIVGGVVAARRPRHPVGWLLLAMGILSVLMFAGTTIHHVATDQWWRSFGAWLDAGLWHPSFPVLGLLFLLFPTGLPPSPRWRWLLWGLTGAWVLGVATSPFTTGGLLLEFYPDADPVIAGPWSGPLAAIHDTTQALVFALLFASVASMVVRARRSRGLERQQLKWFAASAVAIAVVFPLSILIVGNGSIGAPLFVLLPISCAVAVLRYRLYDLGRLVGRTVTYTLVTAALVVVYAVGVVTLGEALRLVDTGAGGDLAVAMSTLLVAALFRPLRSRAQRLVDRRFNRSRYDAQRTLDGFARRLRDEVDLAVLTEEVNGVVTTTVDPRHVGLWLAPSSGTSSPR
jgi:hypothetical protein